MNWIFLALLAPFVYAINVFLDKYLIESRFPDYRALPIFSAITALPFFSLLWIFEVGFLNLGDSLLLIFSGVCTILAFSLYLEALIKEESSSIIILIQLLPVFVLSFSYIFLGQSITLQQLIGFSLLILASVLASLKQVQKGKFKFSKALLFMLFADIIWAIGYILIEYVSSEVSIPALLAYESLGVFLGGLLMLIFALPIQKAFFKTVKKIKRLTLGLVFTNEFLFLGGKALTYTAITLGPVAIVSVLGSTQIFFGIILGVVLTLLVPKVFKENFSKQIIFNKGILGLLAFIGVVLVS